MDKRENQLNGKNTRFNENDIALAEKMVEKLSGTMDIIYYLMEHGDERFFVMMLVSANNIDLEALLKKEKRDTDLMFEIDKESSLYALLCQDTKIDGGYHFAERILHKLKLENAEDIYCTNIEIRTTHHEIQFVILKLIETYMQSKQDGLTHQIVFKSLN